MEIIEKNHTSINKKSKGPFKPIDLNLTRSSDLSPDKFEQFCVELLREGFLVKFRAPGDSMYPTICDGDLITVEPIKPLDVIVADIILYRHEYGVTAHRVMRILERSEKNTRSAPEGPQDRSSSETLRFFLRGDAALNDDDPVRGDKILGKVVSVERNCRRLDPHCLRIKLLYKARRWASHLKRLFFSHGHTQTDTDKFLC